MCFLDLLMTMLALKWLGYISLCSYHIALIMTYITLYAWLDNAYSSPGMKKSMHQKCTCQVWYGEKGISRILTPLITIAHLVVHRTIQHGWHIRCSTQHSLQGVWTLTQGNVCPQSSEYRWNEEAINKYYTRNDRKLSKMLNSKSVDVIPDDVSKSIHNMDW